MSELTLIVEILNAERGNWPAIAARLDVPYVTLGRVARGRDCKATTLAKLLPLLTTKRKANQK